MASRGFNFNTTYFPKPKYSRFNLSHERKKTFDAGKLIPLTWWEGLPGDRFKVGIDGIVRTQALLTPMFEHQNMTIRIFKIPLRILVNYDDLEKAFTGGEQGQHIDFPLFECDPSQMMIGTLYDYLELPLPYIYNSGTGVWQFDANASTLLSCSPFPFLAYHRIYNDYYRNEETEAAVTNTSIWNGFGMEFGNLDAVDPATNQFQDSNGNTLYLFDQLHNVGWPRDYFTSALKSTQRGSQVNIELTGNAKVDIKDVEVYASGGTSPSSASTYNGNQIIMGSGTTRQLQTSNASGTGNGGIPHLVGSADLSSVSGIGAIALRTAMNIQALLEKFNLSGYRLDEQNYALFGVHSSDLRKMQAVCCGGVSIPVNVQEVTQQSASTAGSTPLATLGGKAIAMTSQKLAKIYCDEHCIIMVVGSITPHVGQATQGLGKRWTRRTYLDYYIPELQTIGEQEINNQEVYFNFNDSNGDNPKPWAYQSRFSEYKYIPDEIGGDFRASLSFWHQARMYTSLPAFNNNYIKCDPSDRIFAVSSGLTNQHYLGWFNFRVNAVRPMAKYNISKLW